MENKQLMTVKSLLERQDIQAKFKNILNNKANGFMANLSVLVNNSDALKKCDPLTVVSAAVISASLDLPLDPNLGFAAVIPFGDKASFQIMTKGYVQLAQRSGQFKKIDYCSVHKGDTDEDIIKRLKSVLKNKPNTEVIGYASYFELTNGYESYLYMSVDDLKKHGVRYSQTFKQGRGLWKDDFEKMCEKTVLKLLLKKFAPLSIEMQKGVIYDQGVTKDIESEYPDVEYVDNEPVHTIEETPQALKVETPKPTEGKLL
jgi:recombination protein RecT